MTWIRARSEEQIEQRINEILGATARLYGSRRFEEITFVMIAQEADFTRSNLYRYFGTKEEIFLELLRHDMGVWRMEVLSAFSGKQFSIDDFAGTWIGLLVENRRMIKLCTILYTALEPNVSLQALTAFKRATLEEFGVLTESLIQSFPFLTPDTAFEFLFAQLSLAIGAYPMMDLTEKQRDAMCAVGLDTDPNRYRTMMCRSVASLLREFAGYRDETESVDSAH